MRLLHRGDLRRLSEESDGESVLKAASRSEGSFKFHAFYFM